MDKQVVRTTKPGMTGWLACELDCMIPNESWLVGGMTVKVMTTAVSLRQQNESSVNFTWLEKRRSYGQSDQK